MHNHHIVLLMVVLLGSLVQCKSAGERLRDDPDAGNNALSNFFSDFYGQDVCSNSTISFGPSWCTFRNPFVSPVLYPLGESVAYQYRSDLAFRDDINWEHESARRKRVAKVAFTRKDARSQLRMKTGDDDNNNDDDENDDDDDVTSGGSDILAAFRCDRGETETNMYALMDGSPTDAKERCHSVVAVATLETNITMADANNYNNRSTAVRIAARGLISGEVVLTEMNNNTFADRWTVSDDGAPVDYLESNRYHPIGVLVTGNKKNSTVTKFWRGADPTWLVNGSPVEVARIVLDQGEQALSRTVFYCGNWTTCLVGYAALVWTPQTAKMRVDVKIIAMEGIKHSFAWDVETSSPHPELMRIHLINQMWNTSGVALRDDNQNRQLLVLSDNSQVSIFELNVDNIGLAPLPFHPDSETLLPSIFYRAAPGSEIVLAKVYSEELGRFRTIGGFLASTGAAAMWLSVITSIPDTAPTEYNVTQFQLSEFSDFTLRYNQLNGNSSSESGLPLERLLNPALRIDNFWVNCNPWTSGWVTDHSGNTQLACVDRVIRSLGLGTERPRQMAISWRGFPPAMFPFIGFFYCQKFCIPVMSDPTKFQKCTQLFDIQCPPDPWTLVNSMTVDVLFLRSSLSQFLLNTIFVSFEASPKVTVMGVQQLYGTESDIVFRELNKLYHIGHVEAIHATDNAQHLLVGLSRGAWELRSMLRFEDICDRLTKDHFDNKFLSAYAPQCNATSFDDRLIGFNHFTQMSSLCPPGVLCPSVIMESISVVPQGYYTKTLPMRLMSCERGYFCPQGQRQPCPIGRTCPGDERGMPVPCQQPSGYNYTCYQEGLAEPDVCPDGTVCTAPYFPGLPVPPGTISSPGPRLDASRGEFEACPTGSWCPLGRYLAPDFDPEDIQNIKCPAYTACDTPAVLQPRICVTNSSYSSYCPEGTSLEIPCPAGSYCFGANSSIECSLRDYCPSGSLLYAKCPAGFYCPSPAEKFKCPKGHYCREGSVEPTHCHFLTACPAGTSNEKKNYAGLLLLLLLVVLIIGGYKAYTRYRDKRRTERDARRTEMKSKLTALKHTGGSSKASNKSQFTTEASQGLLPPEEGLDAGSDLDLENTFDYSEMDDRTAGSESVSMAGDTLAEDQFRMDISFDGLGLVLANGKSVLKGVTGQLRSGEVTAVMGPSGAGKTTFLSTLSGKATYGKVIGKVLINGFEDNITNYKSFVGFVPQEDVMLRTATVKEILEFNASARLSTTFSAKRREQIVYEVMDTLGLHHIRHSEIGDETKRGISGGQRKRVNIGMELVALPKLLFLDEPTSGLDSKASKDVVACLRRIAEGGLTVATVLHQPSYEVFRMFHSVLLLGPGGRTVYLGPSEGAMPYFESLGFQCPPHANPADFIMEVIAGDHPRRDHPGFVPADLFDLWEERRKDIVNGKATAASAASPPPSPASPAATAVAPLSPVPVPRRSLPGFFRLTAITTYRALVQVTRNLDLFMLDNFLVLLAGLFLGIIYADQLYQGPPPREVSLLCPDALKFRCELPLYDPIINSASMIVLAVSLTSIMASLRVFGAERVVYWREASSTNWKFTPSYFIGKNVAALPGLFLTPVIFLSMYYTLVSPRARISDYYYILLLLVWAVSGLGYLVSAVVPPSLSQLAGVVLILILMSVSGANPTLAQLRQMHMIWFADISAVRWFTYLVYIIEIREYGKVFEVGSSLDMFEFSYKDIGLASFIGFAIGVIARALALFFLIVLNRKKKK